MFPNAGATMTMHGGEDAGKSNLSISADPKGLNDQYQTVPKTANGVREVPNQQQILTGRKMPN